MVIFYTLPPISYEYIIINANKPKIGLAYLRKHKSVVKSVIIDSGIEIFRDPKVFDYPSDHIYKILQIHNRVRWLLPKAEVYATVPDYCDDYHPKALWISKDFTNIERTTQNILKYTRKFDYVNWLIPIQGWNKQPKSILRAINQLKEAGILDKYEKFGIGNLCVEPNSKISFKTIQYARKLLPKKWLHIFGLKLKAIPLVFSYINSFDSLAWTRPINHSVMVKKGGRYVGWSCKTEEERVRFFIAWLNRLNDLLAQKSLTETVQTES